jgi:uncharacterized protein
MTSRSSVARLWIQSSENVRRPTDVSVRIADTFWSRLIGLLGRRSLGLGEGLLLDPCSSIHTMGMRFSIDVVFLDRAGRVLGFADDVVPNRVRVSPRGTSKVLEVAVGNRSRTGIHLDDYLIFD